jgi:hypothetical protein
MSLRAKRGKQITDTYFFRTLLKLENICSAIMYYLFWGIHSFGLVWFGGCPYEFENGADCRFGLFPVYSLELRFRLLQGLRLSQ